MVKNIALLLQTRGRFRFIVAFLLALLALEGLIVARGIKWVLYEVAGIQTTGVITQMEDDWNVVRYSYTISDSDHEAETYTGASNVNAPEFQRSRVGMPIEIKYLSYNPARSELAVNLWNPILCFALVLCPLPGTIAWLLLYMIKKRP